MTKHTPKVGDRVKCPAGNMGLFVIGTVISIKPAFKFLPPRLSVEGTLNHCNLKWHGEVWADEAKIL